MEKEDSRTETISTTQEMNNVSLSSNEPEPTVPIAYPQPSLSPQSVQTSNNVVPRDKLEIFLAGMIATAVTAPGIAIVVIVIVYVGLWPGSGALALLLGMLVGILGWCILAAVVPRFFPIDRANPSVYRELHSRFDALQAQMRELEAYDEPSNDQVSSQVRKYALREAQAHIDRLHNQL